jgi:hypothetical protein
MFVRILTVGLCLLLAVGCAKKTAKKPAADDTPAPKVQLQQPSGAPSAGGNKKDDKDAPNWLDDSRFKTEGGPALPSETPPNGKPGWGVGPPPPGGWTAPPPTGAPVTGGAPNPMGALPAPVPGAPAIGVAPVAPNPEPPKPPTTTTTTPKYSTVTEADMKEVWVFVENFSGANGGKMPSQLLIYQALLAADSKAVPLVKDGSIYLTGTTTRESIWAYETKAILSGGLVCSQNGVETLTAAELKKRLEK